MLTIENLSFWEKETYFNHNDFVIIGAGIVGYTTAFWLRKKYPTSKILILERGYLPSGASTKNAGFTCFGSPTEIYDDLQHIPENLVWETVSERFQGLQKLFSIVEPDLFDYKPCGSWDLIEKKEDLLPNDFLLYLNQKIRENFGSGYGETYTQDKNIDEKFGFNGFYSSYHNKLEGAINTGKLIQLLFQKITNLGINVLFGVKVDSFNDEGNEVVIQTNIGNINCSKLIICTNGFSKELSQKLEVEPARAQVVVTSPLKNLNWEGTFHLDRGYYYFRNIENRILIGGGRNLDFEGETTTDLSLSPQIQEAIENLLKTMIIPHAKFEITDRWAGIMGVGKEKKPIIKILSNNVAVGVRLGGMGVAIGANVGQKLANIF